MSAEEIKVVRTKWSRQGTFVAAFLLTVVPTALAYLFIEHAASFLGQGFITNAYGEQPVHFALWVLVVLVLVIIYGLMLAACHERMIKKFSGEQVESANSIWHIAIVAGIVALGAAERHQVVTEIDLQKAASILETWRAFTHRATGDSER